MARLLILSSNPRGDLNLEREFNDLTTAVQDLGKFELRFGLGIQSQQLPDLLSKHSPQFVHFCGHGAGEQGLVFQDERGRERFISTEALTQVFEAFQDEVNCVVLNACDSDRQAEAMVNHINYVIGMCQPILDEAAHSFAVGFYKGLADGYSIEKAYKLGCVAVRLWSENNAQSTQSGQHRKAEYVGAIAPSIQPNLPEYRKPVLRKKSALPPAKTESNTTETIKPASTPVNLPLTSAVLPAPTESNATEKIKPASTPSNSPSNSADSHVQQPVAERQQVSPPVKLNLQQVPPPATLKLPPGFVETVCHEIDRKRYKNQARAAYDNFGQYSAENAASLTNLTKSNYEQRKILLRQVKAFWIEGFLKPSLQNSAMLRLDLKDRPDAIANISHRIEATSVELNQSFEELRTTRIYDEMGQGRTLLILGNPGAGKTIALLQLAQRLIERSEENPGLPMPVVFNLSSWAKDRKAIADWLSDELREKYQVPQSLSHPWITQQQLILLLDGLDEVNEAYRNDCVRALNEFIQLFPQTEMAVCSRVRDYEALTERLQISSALCLQPLSSQQVYDFLDSMGEPLAGLSTLLKQNADLEHFAQTPLILNLMSSAYQGWSVEKLQQLRSTPDRNQHLFDTYVDRRLENTAPSYPRHQVLRWLSNLANQMVQEKQTVFLIEKMQPNWLQSQKEKRCYRFVSSTINLVIRELSQEIKPLERLTWSWRRFKLRAIREFFTGIVSGLVFWLIVGLILGLILEPNSSERGAGVLGGMAYGLVFGLFGGILSGLTLAILSGLGSSEIEHRISPNQGIHSSQRNCTMIAGGVGLAYGLIGFIVGLLSSRDMGFALVSTFGVWFCSEAFFGPIVMLKYGGAACIQHFTLRWILSQKGRLPWNYAKFLDFASNRLLMKKVGGGYVFFHRMLLEHFAQMNSRYIGLEELSGN